MVLEKQVKFRFVLTRLAIYSCFLMGEGRRKEGGKSHHQSFDAAVYKLAACVSDVNSLLF